MPDKDIQQLVLSPGEIDFLVLPIQAESLWAEPVGPKYKFCSGHRRYPETLLRKVAGQKITDTRVVIYNQKLGWVGWLICLAGIHRKQFVTNDLVFEICPKHSHGKLWLVINYTHTRTCRRNYGEV